MDQPHREPVEEFNSYRCVTSCVHSFIRFDFKYCLLYVFYLIWDWIQGRGQANHPSEESIQFVMTAIDNMIFNTITAKWSSLSLSKDIGRQGTSPKYQIRYLSHTICQIQPNHLQIVRRQCCLDLGYKANPSHALCSLELEHTWLLIRMISMININISTTNRWQQWSPGRRSEQRRCLCRMHCICCRLLSRKDLVWCLLFDVFFHFYKIVPIV